VSPLPVGSLSVSPLSTATWVVAITYTRTIVFTETEEAALAKWKPMEEDYNSPTNRIGLNPDDEEVILTGYSKTAVAVISVYYRITLRTLGFHWSNRFGWTSEVQRTFSCHECFQHSKSLRTFFLWKRFGLRFGDLSCLIGVACYPTHSLSLTLILLVHRVREETEGAM